jgi:peroxiredoxin
MNVQTTGLNNELKQQIADFQKEMFPQIPKEVLEVLLRTTEDQVKSGVADKALKVGDKAPDFALPNVRGESVSLSDVLAKGPAVVTFYRGHWWPYCNLQLQAYQKHLTEMQAQGASLIAISPQSPDNSLTMAEKNDLQFEVLSDSGNDIARQFGLAFRLVDELETTMAAMGLKLPEFNGDDAWELPIPATYVIDTDGSITLAYIDADYTRRLEPSEILGNLQAQH